jgi:hypothetical protein
MAAEKVPLGMNAKLYRNSGSTFLEPASFAGVNIKEVTNVRDLTLALDKATADVTTRGNGGWRAMVGTLKDGSVEFEMIADPSDENYVAIRAAWLSDTPIQFAVMSGPLTSPPPPGSEGLIAVFSVNNVSRAEPLEGAQMASVTMTPTYVNDVDFKPAWKEVAGVP